ncbi:MAG: hypothetical protein ACRDI2_09935 [Chloroflexota bacterium]
MNANNAEQRLVDAETRLAHALQRLHALRRAALAGGYDPVEFDQALMAYRRAEKEALEAREAWANAGPSHVEQAVGVAEPAVEEPPAAFEPTPRMRFIRWMVETGRLSEWDVADETSPEVPGPKSTTS